MDNPIPQEYIPIRQRIHVGEYILSLVTCGPQEGPPVIFLHGIPTSAELWRPMQFYFAQRGYRTFAPDLPGFGKTICQSPEKASWQDSLNLIQQWIKADNSLQDIWWIGHQAGGLLAGQCAQRHEALTRRLTSISPPLAEDGLWPTRALRWMPHSIQWGLYDQLIRANIYPNILQRQQLGAKLANVKKLDVYLDRKVLFNEKVHDETRRSEFVNFIKKLPSGIEGSLQQTLRALKCPVQVIATPLPTPSFFYKVLQKIKHSQHQTTPREQRILAQLEPFLTDSVELISVNGGNLFSPLETPQTLAETALLWADPTLRNDYIATAEKAKAKPILKNPIRPEGIRIDSSLTLPPDGSPPDKPPLAASVK